MSCKTILPTNLDETINALDLAGCQKLSNIKEQVKKIKDFNNPLKIDESFLELLIDEYEAYRFIEFEDNKRELVVFAQKNYPKLGTIGAVKKALEASGINADIKEWFEYGGKPYCFIVSVDIGKDDIFKQREYKSLVRLTQKTKNARSILDGIEIENRFLDKNNLSSAITFETTIEKDLKVDWKHNEELYFNTAGVFSPTINKDLNPNFNLTQELNFTQGAAFETTIEKDLKVDWKMKDKNTLTGAVIWQL